MKEYTVVTTPTHRTVARAPTVAGTTQAKQDKITNPALPYTVVEHMSGTRIAGSWIWTGEKWA